MAETYRLKPEAAGKMPSLPGKGPTPPSPVKDQRGMTPAAPSPGSRPVAASTAEESLRAAVRADEATRTKMAGERLVSLDAYRGFIMFVLAASGFGIARFAALPDSAPVWQTRDRETWQAVRFHFDHPAWRSNFVPSWLTKSDVPEEQQSGFLKIGVSFWDLIQPAFMFMVGVAMPFSYARRAKSGQSGGRRFLHALWRALLLVLIGVFLSSTDSARTNWIFPNVLCQIGLGYIFAYLLLGWRWWLQVVALAAILGGYWWFMERHDPPADYNYAAVKADPDKGEVYDGKFASWSKNANSAHLVDFKFLNLLRNPSPEEMAQHGIERDAESWAPPLVVQWLFSKTEPFLFNEGGYQTLNFVPSIGTTLLGILCGQLLLSTLLPWKKTGILVGAGVLCLVLGLVAGEFACPIVKRIWTPSWVLFSGAWVIWLLAAFYATFDILPLRKLAFPLVVVGMNSIAIYLMGQLMRGWTVSKVVRVHFHGLLESIFGSAAMADDMYGRLIEPTAAALVFWLIALWMWKRGLFLRL